MNTCSWIGISFLWHFVANYLQHSSLKQWLSYSGVCLSSHGHLNSVCVYFVSLIKVTCHWTQITQIIQDELILTSSFNYICKDLFPKKEKKITNFRMWPCLLGGHHSIHYSILKSYVEILCVCVFNFS